MSDAFALGDVGTAVAAMAKDIVWNEAENFQYVDDNSCAIGLRTSGLAAL